MNDTSLPNTKIHILFFASLGETLGCQEETATIEESITVSQLRQELSQRGEPWQTLLENKTIRCAVNQQLASENTIIPLGAEVAFFPPVTGG